MATAVLGRPLLGIFRDGDWPLEPPRRGRGRPRVPSEEGYPTVIGRASGYPLEVRVWHERPAGVADAAYHPSGCWVAVRVLGSPSAAF